MMHFLSFQHRVSCYIYTSIYHTILTAGLDHTTITRAKMLKKKRQSTYCLTPQLLVEDCDVIQHMRKTARAYQSGTMLKIKIARLNIMVPVPSAKNVLCVHRHALQKYKNSDTGTRTLVSCVRGKYANHLHHIGFLGLIEIIKNYSCLLLGSHNFFFYNKTTCFLH